MISFEHVSKRYPNGLLALSCFALEDGPAVSRIETEELLLAFGVPGVVADAVIGPVPQAGGRQEAE